MITDTAMVALQYVYRCCHPLCSNTVSVAPTCPAHGGWKHLNAVMASSPVYDASAHWAACRGDFRRTKVSA